MKLPDDHPQRIELNDEVHARPPEPMTPPCRASYIVLFTGRSSGDTHWRAAADLAERFGVRPPEPGLNHFSADLGAFRVKWERHTEFVRYTFIADGVDESDPFGDPAIAQAPEDWLAGLDGDLMYAAHAVLVWASGKGPSFKTREAELFDDHELVGAEICAGGGVALTDFRIHPDGFNRILLRNQDMPPHQAGRFLQRVLEIDTYRIMALMALPIARQLAAYLTAREAELAEITKEMAQPGVKDEPALLDRLTRLEADIESRYSENHYRFGAAAAYYDIVKSRIEELRERRVHGLQTFSEFTERRLAPAMNTCQAVSLRQESLSKRVARATQLLSTRVAVSREGQSQELLETMARRAKLQLRLQQTVEGLSVAAVTYYVVGLIGYAARGVQEAGLAVNPALVMAISIPFVAGALAFGVRRMRKMIAQRDD